MPESSSPFLASASVTDFQSLANLRVKFSDMTVIVGKNSVGKSAFIRALEAAFYNRAGGTFIRDGATSTEVELVFAGRVGAKGGMRPPSVTWRKPAKGGAEIDLDNGVSVETISRIGKQLPPALLELTGVREYSIGTMKIRPQFMGQGAAAFLLAESGTKAASVLARVSGLDVVVQAQTLAKRKRTAVQMKEAAAEAREIELQEKLDGQPDYEAMLERWRQSAETIAALRAREATNATLRSYANDIPRLRALRARWQAADLPAGIAASTLALSRLEAAQAAAVAYSGAVLLQDRHVKALLTLRAEAQIVTPARVEKVQALETAAHDARSAVVAYRSAAVVKERHAASLAVLQAVVEIVTPVRLDKVQSLETASHDARTIVMRYMSRRSEHEAAGKAAAAATQELTDAEAALHEALDGMEICPVCQRAM